MNKADKVHRSATNRFNIYISFKMYAHIIWHTTFTLDELSYKEQRYKCKLRDSTYQELFCLCQQQHNFMNCVNPVVLLYHYQTFWPSYSSPTPFPCLLLKRGRGPFYSKYKLARPVYTDCVAERISAPPPPRMSSWKRYRNNYVQISDVKFYVRTTVNMQHVRRRRNYQQIK